MTMDSAFSDQCIPYVREAVFAALSMDHTFGTKTEMANEGMRPLVLSINGSSSISTSH